MKPKWPLSHFQLARYYEFLYHSAKEKEDKENQQQAGSAGESLAQLRNNTRGKAKAKAKAKAKSKIDEGLRVCCLFLYTVGVLCNVE